MSITNIPDKIYKLMMLNGIISFVYGPYKSENNHQNISKKIEKHNSFLTDPELVEIDGLNAVLD